MLSKIATITVKKLADVKACSVLKYFKDINIIKKQANSIKYANRP